MRIAMLSCDPRLVFGGGQRCPVRMQGLALALARAGHEVTAIVAASDADAVERLPELGVRTLRLPVSLREVDWHFSSVQPDLVIESLLPGSLEGALAARDAGIVHLYDLDHELDQRALAMSPAVRGALPEALGVTRGALVLCESAAARLQSLSDTEVPVAVIANGAGMEFLAAPSREERERLAVRLRLTGPALRVGFFGTLARECGLLTLIESLGEIGRERAVRLLVVGDGPERNAALAVAHASHTPMVLCGRVPHRELPEHLALCDIVVTPGEEDGGAPITLLGAMAMERAIVAPATAAVRSVARDGADAVLVPPGDGAALTVALRSLADAPARRARLGASARRAVHERHTWDAQAARLIEFVREAGGDELAAVRASWRERNGTTVQARSN
jgi:glycosyltransferase involved in cell wall biosynthesis